VSEHEIVTSSLLSKFRECPRRCQIEYHEKRVPVSEAPALSFGKSWHSALEAMFEAATDKMRAGVDALKAQSDKIDPATAAMLSAMLCYYNPQMDDFEVVGVEEEFDVPIEHPDEGKRAFRGYRLRGKVDLRLRRKSDGRIWILDHKTTSCEIVGFGDYWRALQIDGQMSNYCLAFGAAGFIYDVARKPSIKLCGKDEKEAALCTEKGVPTTPAEAFQARCAAEIAAEPTAYYQWREHTKCADDHRQARLDLWQCVEAYRACINAGRFMRNPGACVGRYGCCPYLEVCCGRARLDDDSCFRTKVAQNEELAT
jgi:hypothetical protein